MWFYDPGTQTVTLKTIFGVNPDPDVDAANYDGPDNMTLSPHGGLILAEDGEGVQHLVGVTEDGRTYPMARNDLNGSEFTGPAFSADGKVLFANIQSPGHVFAITGPGAGTAPAPPADGRPPGPAGPSGPAAGRRTGRRATRPVR